MIFDVVQPNARSGVWEKKEKNTSTRARVVCEVEISGKIMIFVKQEFIFVCENCKFVTKMDVFFAKP